MVKWQWKNGKGKNGNGKNGTGKNGNGRNGTDTNGRWPDLKKRTALFSQYTVYWAAPHAAFFITPISYIYTSSKLFLPSL